MLTEAELARMRTTLNDSLPGTCVIWRATAGTADGAGGYSGGSVTASGTVICRVQPITPHPAQTMEAGQLIVTNAWVVTVPALSDVTSRDRIASGGQTFEVLGVLGTRTYELSRRAICREVKPE